MKPISFFKKDFIVGIDIGSSSIKVAQFVKKEGKLCLVKTDSRENVPGLLKGLLRGIDTKRSKIIVNVNCPKTALRKVTVPHIPKGELRDGIKLELKNYFPFPIEDPIFDFEILGDVVEGGVRKYNVIVAVSPRETIENFLSTLKEVGIKPASLVPCVYSMQRLALEMESKTDEIRCFLDIGKLYTELAIFRGKEWILSRKIPVSGSDFTKAMTGVLVSDRGKTELSVDEAEEIKREIGIPSGDEAKIIKDKISTTQILAMLRMPLEQLVNEMDRCFDYYREETGGGKIDKVVLFGRGATIKGLPTYLQEKLGTGVMLGDSPQVSTAIGAGLTEGKGLNLLPPEYKEETKRVFKRVSIQGVSTAAVLASVLVYVGMKIQLDNFQKRISVAKLEFSSLQPQVGKAMAHHLANSVLADEPYWEDIFKELSNVIPNNIYLTCFNIDNNCINLKGIVTAEDGEEVLSGFILTLEKGIFKNVKLVKTKDLKERTGSEFELKCLVD